MRVAINLDNLKSVMWDGSPLPREIFTARHDRVPFEVKFLQGGVLRELPEGAVGRAGVKIESQQAGNYLAYSDSWVKSGAGRDAVYTFVLDLNTISVESLFSTVPPPAFVSAVLEMQWGYPVGGVVSRETSLPVKIRIANDYVQGNEAVPSAAESINALKFSAQNSVPAAPAAGKKLFLNADGKFSAVDDAGNVELLGAGAAPAGTGIVVVSGGTFGIPLPLSDFASSGHTHTTFSDTPPLNPKNGDRWVDSVTIRAYERLDGSWIETAVTTST